MIDLLVAWLLAHELVLDFMLYGGIILLVSALALKYYKPDPEFWDNYDDFLFLDDEPH